MKKAILQTNSEFSTMVWVHDDVEVGFRGQFEMVDTGAWITGTITLIL